jgi:hypothetical protein
MCTSVRGNLRDILIIMDQGHCSAAANAQLQQNAKLNCLDTHTPLDNGPLRGPQKKNITLGIGKGNAKRLAVSLALQYDQVVYMPCVRHELICLVRKLATNEAHLAEGYFKIAMGIHNLNVRSNPPSKAHRPLFTGSLVPVVFCDLCRLIP